MYITDNTCHVLMIQAGHVWLNMLNKFDVYSIKPQQAQSTYMYLEFPPSPTTPHKSQPSPSPCLPKDRAWSRDWSREFSSTTLWATLLECSPIVPPGWWLWIPMFRIAKFSEPMYRWDLFQHHNQLVWVLYTPQTHTQKHVSLKMKVMIKTYNQDFNMELIS